VTCSSEILADFQKTAWCYILVDMALHKYSVSIYSSFNDTVTGQSIWQ
jgi:hypothetical protein